MTNNSKVVLGIVTAAAAGAVIGLLFAPEKGTELREKVRDTANGLASDFLDVIQRGRQQYAEVEEEVQDKAKELKSKVAGKYAEAKDKVEDEVSNAKHEAENMKDKAQRYA
ncbi:YtxH domain-containing protein [Runella sp.]|jgi:gas vesicle protein|uniref:YtxH domain-containing protein n=1 Tax=Runella sp. TaxID=1960881 RepID=UPI00260857FA|nr:YtxH domain-containing protein [Runella sp.]